MKKERRPKHDLIRILTGYFLLLISALAFMIFKSMREGHLRLGDISYLLVLWMLLCFFLPELNLDKTKYKKIFRRLRIFFFPVLLLMIFFSGIIGGAHWTAMTVITAVVLTVLLPFLFDIKKRRWLFRGMFFILAVLVFCVLIIILPYKTTDQRLREGDLNLRKRSSVAILHDWDTMSSDLEILEGSKDIRELHFENVHMSYQHFDLMASLTYLKEIHFINCRITGSDVTKLACLPYFKVLYLDNVVFIDGGINSLTELNSLKKLTIANTKLQIDDLINISKMQNIKSLSIVNVGEIPAKIIGEIKSRRANMDLYFRDGS